MWMRLQCAGLLCIQLALLASAAEDTTPTPPTEAPANNAVYYGQLRPEFTPCRSWELTCGEGDYTCASQDQYYSPFGDPPTCPIVLNSTTTPPQPSTCVLTDSTTCGFSDQAPTCVSWLHDCYEYSCTVEEEYLSSLMEESSCFIPSPLPPPDTICVPVNDSCEWRNPCRMWQGWCGGQYRCESVAQYATFINGPVPGCIPPSPDANITEPVPAGECVYQDGECEWSVCRSWLSPCQTSWQCGSDYDYRVAQSGPLPPCPYPGDYFTPPTEPGVCEFILESGQCGFQGEPVCMGGQQYQQCGTLCPRTCENFELDFACPLSCIPTCSCPDSTVLHEGNCIPSYLCPGQNPCDTVDCLPGYECRVYEPTIEAYCEPNCEELNPCEPQELCQITTVTCIRAPCPPVLSCQPNPCDTYDCLPGYECQVYGPTGEAYCEPTCEPNPCGPQELCQIMNITCITSPCTGILSCELMNCTGGKEWQDCGTACPLTCDNYNTDIVCTEQCVQDCFCPDNTVLHEGNCIPSYQCPGQNPCDTYDCLPGYECRVYIYEPPVEAYCEPTCDPNPCGPQELCHIMNVTCIRAPCPPLLSCEPNTCTGGKEWQECGTACPLTCDNYENPPLFCTLQCVSDCFCPEGKVDLNGVCVEPSTCSVNCTGGKEWQDCGTACPLTCDNYNTDILCTLQCVSDCFCPLGTVLDDDEDCVPFSECPGYISPCAYTDCIPGYTCEVYELTNEAYCEPTCSVPSGYPFLPCREGETCELREGDCDGREPCPHTLHCIPPEPCKAWRRPCFDQPWTCTSYEQYEQFLAGPQLGCPILENSTLVPHPGQCVLVDGICNFRVNCTGGKEWNTCGTACPLTCDNYEIDIACTRQCVQDCFCSEGKVDLNGVCVEPSTCSDCNCEEGQECFAVHNADYEYTSCKDPIAVPCSAEAALPCPSNARCLTHNTTGASFCLESCYQQNGACPDDQVCYSERKDENCNQLLGPCFKTTCTDFPSDQDACPSGWVLDECGSLCQRTCEDYLTGGRIACPEICGPADCVCPPGMVVFRDRCVDPLECYTLVNGLTPLHPLPQPGGILLVQITLIGMSVEEFDGVEFAESVQSLIENLGFGAVEVSVYAVLEEDGNAVVVLKFESANQDMSDRLSGLIIDNSEDLNVQVGAVSIVDVPTAPPEDDGGDNSSAVVAGSVVAVIAVCVIALLVLFIAVMIVIKVSKQRHVEAGKQKSDELNYAALFEKDNDYDFS